MISNIYTSSHAITVHRDQDQARERRTREVQARSSTGPLGVGSRRARYRSGVGLLVGSELTPEVSIRWSLR